MEVQTNTKTAAALAIMRIILGLMLFWGFLDKMFGLGFPTPESMSYLNGGSPTEMYLVYTDGWFAPFFHWLSNYHAIADVILLAGMFLLGLSMTFGFCKKISTVAFVAMMTLFYLSAIQPSDNPIFDYHLIYIVLGFAFYFGSGYEKWGMCSYLKETEIVKRFPILE